jgi:hypothetical protein
MPVSIASLRPGPAGRERLATDTEQRGDLVHGAADASGTVDDLYVDHLAWGTVLASWWSSLTHLFFPSYEKCARGRAVRHLLATLQMTHQADATDTRAAGEPSASATWAAQHSAVTNGILGYRRPAIRTGPSPCVRPSSLTVLRPKLIFFASADLTFA